MGAIGDGSTGGGVSQSDIHDGIPTLVETQGTGGNEHICRALLAFLEEASDLETSWHTHSPQDVFDESLEARRAERDPPMAASGKPMETFAKRVTISDVRTTGEDASLRVDTR